MTDRRLLPERREGKKHVDTKRDEAEGKDIR